MRIRKGDDTKEELIICYLISFYKRKKENKGSGDFDTLAVCLIVIATCLALIFIFFGKVRRRTVVKGQ